jgi:monoterpene epsilon-lactone hydrolase
MANNFRNTILRGLVRLLFGRKRSIPEIRTFIEKSARMSGKLPSGIQAKQVDINGINAEWLFTSEAPQAKVILYLHGGGYVSGSIRSHRVMCVPLAKQTGLRILTPGYRLAPEHPFPAALEDVLSVYRWLLKQRYESKNIFLAGDSAGGGLSLAAVLSLREQGDPLPAGVICLSPWADLSLSGDTYRTNEKSEPVLSIEDLSEWALVYAGRSNHRNPLVSPVYADYQGLPRILIQVGSEEVLLDDARSIEKKASAAGVDVSLNIYEGMWHVWHTVGTSLPEARAAFEEIHQFVHART